MRSNYKPIGNYIRLVDDRNRDLKVTLLLGLSINKVFIPSVANVIGSDMTNYKIIRKGQFSCSLMQVRRDKKIPVALQRDFEEAIISQAYPVFEIINHEELDPEYLMMWMTRSEFDRHACFLAVGGVRGSLEWEDFCEMELPVPSIEKQREIVREYNIIVNRIKLNEQLNQKLEETAQTVYKHWFVDFEFPLSAEYAVSIGKPELEGKPYKSSGGKMRYCEVLEQDVPLDWKAITLKNFCAEMKSGATPSRGNPLYWSSRDIPWLKTGEVANCIIIESEEYISQAGFDNSSTKIIPENSVLIAMYGDGKTKGQVGFLKIKASTNQACCALLCSKASEAAFLYYHLRYNEKKIKSYAIGGAQENLSKTLLEKLPIIKIGKSLERDAQFLTFIERQAHLLKERHIMQKICSLLLSNIAKTSLEATAA